MGLITALNASDSSGDDSDREDRVVSEEVLETEAFTFYNDALRKLAKKEYEDASQLLKRVLEHPFILKNEGPLGIMRDGSMHPSRHMKYASLKNLAVIATQHECDWSKAAELYLAALDIDNTDVTVWHKLGKVALKLKNYPMAAEAFQGGLAVNPRHWLCLDESVVVRHVITDDIGCLHLIAQVCKGNYCS